jgi:hypothetical protein
MLLSSQAFSGFLNELSGTTPTSSVNGLPQSQSRSQLQPPRKDINPHHVARKLQNHDQQIGMATIPEASLDFALPDNSANVSSWNMGIGLTNFPVYSVTKLPEGPALDIEKLSGKVQDLTFPLLEPVKRDMPVIEPPTILLDAEAAAPTSAIVHSCPCSDLEGSALSLYTELNSNIYNDDRISGRRSDITLQVDTEATLASKLILMCSRLDAVSTRIAAVTSHLG